VRQAQVLIPREDVHLVGGCGVRRPDHDHEQHEAHEPDRHGEQPVAAQPVSCATDRRRVLSDCTTVGITGAPSGRARLADLGEQIDDAVGGRDQQDDRLHHEVVALDGALDRETTDPGHENSCSMMTWPPSRRPNCSPNTTMIGRIELRSE